MPDPKITIEVNGRAWDCPAATYETTDEEYLIGVEITDMQGVLHIPRIAVFTSCGFEGTKVFLTPDQARDLAAQIRFSADAVDQGHRTLVQH